MNQFDDITFNQIVSVMGRVFVGSGSGITTATAIGQVIGWDSFGHLTLMMEIEKEFCIRVPTDKINEPRTVGEICLLVDQIKAK